MPAAFETYTVWNNRLPMPKLTRWLREMETLRPPPLARGRRIRLCFMTQIKSRPPTFVLSVSQPEELGDDYLRFLVNRLRDDSACPACRSASPCASPRTPTPDERRSCTRLVARRA